MKDLILERNLLNVKHVTGVLLEKGICGNMKDYILGGSLLNVKPVISVSLQ